MWPVALGVFLLSIALRLPGLSRPPVLVFDEIFYAPDAADLLRWGIEHGQAVHPPLGKWFIAAGISLFGFDPVGWRVASVLAGGALSALVAASAGRLSGRRDAAWAAGGAVALDGLVHVTSRLALLDVFVAVATTATVSALIEAWRARTSRRPAWPWWSLSLVALGAGTAVKWSAFALAPLVVAVGWWLAGDRNGPGRARLRVGVVAAALVVPLAWIAVASAPRLAGPDPGSPGRWRDEQVSVLRFHRDLRPTNRHAASAWTWIPQTHPSILYTQRCRAGDGTAVAPVACAPGATGTARIVAGANPVVWGSGLVGLAAVLAGAWRRRPVDLLLAAAVGLLWVPFLISPRAGYSFYAVTIVPVTVMAASWSLWSRTRREVARTVQRGVLAAAALAFVALWPLWSAAPLGDGMARWLTWWPGWI